jgi:two-component system LytT family response regulator
LSKKTIHTVLIVDDEPPARALLKEYLSPHTDVHLIGECANGFDAVRAVSELSPELVILDIQMPKLNGIEVVELIGFQQPVIFVTAYDQYALKAFEVHAVDYLLKPFSKERFDAALLRAWERIAQQKTQLVEEVVRDLKQKPIERIAIREGTKVRLISTSKIEYIKAEDDYIAIAAEGKKHLKQLRLSDLELQLEPALFVRVHRSYIVNITFLDRIELYAKDSRRAVMKSGEHIPISRSGYEKLKAIL